MIENKQIRRRNKLNRLSDTVKLLSFLFCSIMAVSAVSSIIIEGYICKHLKTSLISIKI